jgi:hypothetical protein
MLCATPLGGQMVLGGCVVLVLVLGLGEDSGASSPIAGWVLSCLCSEHHGVSLKVINNLLNHVCFLASCCQEKEMCCGEICRYSG